MNLPSDHDGLSAREFAPTLGSRTLCTFKCETRLGRLIPFSLAGENLQNLQNLQVNLH